MNSKTYVMGIINLTPDSFSSDGLYGRSDYIDRAVQQAKEMVDAGADFLDVGAESTRPGGPAVDEAEEARRLFPALRELVSAVKVPFSVDTYKPRIAEQVLNLGVAMLNDIWGLLSPDDPERRMARIAGDSGVPVIVMHNAEKNAYQDLMPELIARLEDSIRVALDHGVREEQIIVDPGVGFAKSQRDNLQVIRELDRLKILGRPILLGTSRKSVIGNALNLPVTERLEGTIATTVWGVIKGANIVRVHDVKAIVRASRMCDAIASAGDNQI
ncbi:MAG TPA: dihydropteroate synthase [Bacillota bacterium]